MVLTHRALTLALVSVVVLCFLAGPSTAVLENQTGQVTVFWGRHKDEGSLREACDTGMYTTVIISFLNVSGHGRYELDLSGHPLAGIGDDVKHCQHAGVAASLSIVSGNNNDSLPTTNQSAALDLSDHLWNAYLGGSRKGVHRPFGDAWLDGIDLFIEQYRTSTKAHHYDVLARDSVRGRGKPLHLTATLPCASPGLLASGTSFERIHVRFYGDHDCENWDKWTAGYPSSRIYLGLPASPEAAKEGYLYPKSLYYGVLPKVQMAANYGGVMLWDRFYDKGSNYSSYVKRWA